MIIICRMVALCKLMLSEIVRESWIQLIKGEGIFLICMDGQTRKDSTTNPVLQIFDGSRDIRAFHLFCHLRGTV